MEQIRIVKEMREQDASRRVRSNEPIRPRYMVWENVPGAFSSNKAEDFRIVLEELAKICDKDAVIPRPPKDKWTTSGCIMGDGWSIAWRVCDAQFYGVPQRRRRIALVADFGGESAPEILFVRKSVSGNTEPSQPQRKETPTDATRGFGADDREPNVAYTMQDREGKAGCGKGALFAKDLSATLRAGFAQTLFQPVQSECYGVVTKGNGDCFISQERHTALSTGGGQAGQGYPCVCYSVENHPADSRVDIDESGKVQTLTSRMDTGGGNVPMVMECYSKSKRAQSATDDETWKESDVANTLNAFDIGDKRTTECVVAYCIGNGQAHDAQKPDKELCKTLNCMDDPMKICVAYGNAIENDVNGALQSNMAHSLNGNNVIRTKYIVRRLTPLECERLQGYPDGWTDIGEWVDSKGKVHKTSDAARYKALGNSIALPPWKWVMKRISACYERDATLASLFDGIGGFPLIWEQINGKGTCLWASEIEEFPIAVTKKRIGG